MMRKALGLRPRATDPLVIVDKPDASYVVFGGYAGDTARGRDPYTCLRFHVLYNQIDLANIHVEPRLRGRGVAERLVRAVSDAHPGLPMSFSGTNGHSRRLARKLAQGIIPLFDAVAADQEANFEDDLAHGFYGEVSPPVRSLEDVLKRPHGPQDDGTAPPAG